MDPWLWLQGWRWTTVWSVTHDFSKHLQLRCWTGTERVITFEFLFTLFLNVSSALTVEKVKMIFWWQEVVPGGLTCLYSAGEWCSGLQCCYCCCLDFWNNYMQPTDRELSWSSPSVSSCSALKPPVPLQTRWVRVQLKHSVTLHLPSWCFPTYTLFL